jgi:ATP-binding cassette subfamily B protein
MSDTPTSDPQGRPGEGAALVSSIYTQAETRAKTRDLRPLTQLLPLIANHKGQAFIALFFLIIASGSSLGLTGALREVVDKGFNSGLVSMLDRYFFLAAVVVLVLAAASASRYYFVTRLGERVIADLRAKLYRHITTLDPAYFLRTRTGEVLSRLTTDMAIVEGLLSTSASVALRNSLLMIGSIAVLFTTSPRLTLYVVIFAPIVIAPMFVFGRRVRKRSIETQERFAEAVGYAGESLDALDTVQAFGQETAAADRFAKAVEGAFQMSVRRMGARAFMIFMVMSLVFGGVGLVLWMGAHSVIDHTMTPGALIQFVALSAMAAGAVGALGDVWGDMQKASGAMSRIHEVLQAHTAIAAPVHPVALPSPPRGEIDFDQVTFAYPSREESPALRGFSLHVKPGETVALVGPSGAGKSTVLRLLLRFYDPQSGAIRIDGVRLTDADPQAVRERLALVAQDASLFSGSASENIRFGRADATDDDVRLAARAAEAEGFLNALPEGFNTPIGERAKTLSGGQRQRLAIARALIRNAPILLLDEATSALDAENERLVQLALSTAMTGRTTLVIAHRLATVLKADRIIVMDEGHVVEEGTHAELSAKGGLYAKLARLQFGLEAA